MLTTKFITLSTMLVGPTIGGLFCIVVIWYARCLPSASTAAGLFTNGTAIVPLVCFEWNLIYVVAYLTPDGPTVSPSPVGIFAGSEITLFLAIAYALWLTLYMVYRAVVEAKSIRVTLGAAPPTPIAHSPPRDFKDPINPSLH